MKRRLERIPLPELAQLRRALAERAEAVREGAAVADADAQGPTGIDLVLVDGEGRPVFVDIVLDGVNSLPSRIFDHIRWFEQNKRLILRAYSADGLVRAEDPLFVFVATRFPRSALAAVGAMSELPVRLMRAEYFLVDGAPELLLEEVSAARGHEVGTSVARRAGDMTVSAESAARSVIESDAVRALLALFRSGVDGLDGRISVAENNGGMTFALGDRTLAQVSVSPGSFTVSPGVGKASPIVVSDRVSLERALNAVVSMFVREETPREGGNGGARESGLPEEERAELAAIWGSGVRGGDGG